MSSSRRQQNLMRIYQDPEPLDYSLFSRGAYYGPSRLPRAIPLEIYPNPLLQVPRRTVFFSPPVTGPAGPEPHKFARVSKFQPRAVFNDRFNDSFAPPEEPEIVTDSIPKRFTTRTFQPLAPQGPLKALFAPFRPTKPTGKENFDPAIHNDNFAEFPEPTQGYDAPIKQTLVGAAALVHQGQGKPTNPVPPPPARLPDPGEMPNVEDDGQKPPYSYATLIGMAILRAPNRRLTLASIYRWISDTFAYYRVSEAGWQNSIRHNLSLNKAFVKKERAKDDPGKGSYWAIEPGMESQFLKDKPTRRPTSSQGPIMSNMGTKRNHFQAPESLPSAEWHAPKRSTTIAAAKASEPIDISSDATIPASDPACLFDETEEDNHAQLRSTRAPGSPVVHVIVSSPPVAQQSAVHDVMPTTTARDQPAAEHTCSRKRKMGGLNDSGYFSATELAENKTHTVGHVVSSESERDMARIKPGRAEEEIARIRAKSHDISPSKGRATLMPPTTQSICSSPILNLDDYSVFSPWTPATRFKLTPKLKASVSPNAQLREHRNKIRDMVGSPPKTLNLLQEDPPWISALNLPGKDEPFPYDENNFVDFDDILSATAYGSPEKRPTKRPRLERASTTGNILAEITGTTNTGNILHSIQKCPDKSPSVCASFLDIDPFDPDYFLTDGPADTCMEVDILQGFQKIGGK
ncbi:hypothetical protein MMC16_000628 [Acarospora aff. strigata]|nr:hypothetical protein [Acarospora aff. strigata]